MPVFIHILGIFYPQITDSITKDTAGVERDGHIEIPHIIIRNDFLHKGNVIPLRGVFPTQACCLHSSQTLH